MEMNVATPHAAIVRSLPSSVVFGSSRSIVISQSETGRVVANGTSTIHRRTSPVPAATTTVAGHGRQPQNTTTNSSFLYDNSRTIRPTSTTTTTELECCSADQSCSSVDGCKASGALRQTCAACGQHIVDRFLLHALDRYWHTACLRCSVCQAPLDDLGSTCFTRAGMTLCRNDYIR